MFRLPSTDRSSRAQRPLCTLSSWWITSSITSWAGRALPLRTAWVTPLIATARGAAASPSAGSTWCKSWTSWGPCTSMRSRSKEATVTLVPWSRGSGPLVTLTNSLTESRTFYGIFQCTRAMKLQWEWEKIATASSCQVSSTPCTFDFSREQDSDYCWILGKFISNETGISQKLFYKRSLIIDCRTWHNVLETQIWYFVSFIFCLFTAGLGAPSLSPCPPAQHSEI